MIPNNRNIKLVMMPLIIHTSRLLLRVPSPDDVDAFMNAFNHESIVEWFLEKQSLLSREDVIELFETAKRREESNNGFELCIYLKDSGNLIGGVTVWLEQEDMKGEIAFWCTPQYQGIGIATEALCALRNRCFEELGLERLYGACTADNLPSIKVMENAGMRLEGVLRHDCKHGDSFKDTKLFAIIRTDWQALTKG